MSTLIIIALVVGTILLVCWLFIAIERKRKRKEQHQLMHQLSEAGSANSLSFSSQEILRRNIIGVDGLHRKLLVVTVMDDGRCDGVVIHLDQVKNCCVKKHYGPINADDMHLKRLEDHLQRVVLQFELNTGEPPIAVTFYDQADNPVHECGELERRARDWETILSKMLKAPAQKRA